MRHVFGNANRRGRAVSRYISAWFCLFAMLGCGSGAFAQAVATVTNISGVLTAKHTDGSTTMLASKSSVMQGDVLVTEANTYARLKFIDNADMVMRPSSHIFIEHYVYDVDHPEHDIVSIQLLSGGLSSVTGLIGKRNHDAVRFETPAGNIAVRGTTFVAKVICQTTCAGVPTQATVSAASAPGLYVQVLDGLIAVSNTGGTQNFAAGQFGFTASIATPPVIVPANPALQFTPPPAFSAPAVTPASAQKAGSVDCVVR
jgi:hypothetical protein